MRVSLNMIAESSLRNIQANQTRVEQLQEQITSGSRIVRPSDDPIGTAQALGLQESLDQAAQYGKNIDQATTWLNATDSSLGSMTDALHRARELAVQAANGTLSSADRSAIQAEISQIQQHVLDLAHSKQGAYFLFSGTRSDQPGYVLPAASSTPGAYQGNTNLVQREISPGVTIAVNANATSTFDPVFSALGQLQTGLTAGDTAAINASLSSFDGALDGVNIQRAQVGARVNRLETLKQRQDAVSVNLNRLLSNVKDVDMASAITNFTMAQNVYTASLKATAQSMQISLLDYLH